ncbi:borealin [Paramormyrops kingsleyae]|uniref:Cell division cycle associated 8 n=1 Tax=Paramormyrops kingsleyae TaxID=1676925 RepID=A0A3B3QH98_9TELE|nr:borealin [Paramormyrops kingsleyae]XP_023687919.1 borealin [Paramormyrops kingsleyae]
MAPRKRTTNKGRKNDPKTAKLEAFLNDFDLEVKAIVERLKEKTNSFMKDVDNFYSVSLIKLPLAVRQMNWIAFCGSEAQKTPVEDAKKEEVATQVDTVLNEVHTIPAKPARKAVRKPGGSRAHLEDVENITLDQSTLKKGKSTRKAPSTSKRAKALSVSKQNNSIRKSSRRPLVTPARSILECSLIGPTPSITPRFDSRLPKTPGVRLPRHKEKVYSISVNGSPLAGGNNDIIINVPTGNGESLQLLASEMDTMDLSQLDEAAVKSIRLLQNRLTSLCGTAK